MRCFGSSALRTRAVSSSGSIARDRTARFGSSRKSGLLKRNSRSYFPETIRLGPTQIYVSPLDLGRRNGLIEEVHRPTLRVATPIFADDGKPFGIFMVNVDMRRAFDRIRSSVRPGENDLRRQPARRLSHSSRIVRANSARCSASPTTGKPTSRIWRRRSEQRKAAPRSCRTRPARSGRDRACARRSGRHRMGRGHRNHPQRRHHGAGCEHQEHFASGRS